jgi:hypothetical protein
MTHPISESAVGPLQAAVVTRLKADAALVALLKGQAAVYDQPPETVPIYYVRVGDFLSIPDNDHGGYGREITMTLHVWTKYRGNKVGQDISARIIKLLDHQGDALNLVGHRVVSIRHEFDQALTDPDPEIRHHVLRFRVVTAQES